MTNTPQTSRCKEENLVGSYCILTFPLHSKGLIFLWVESGLRVPSLGHNFNFMSMIKYDTMSNDSSSKTSRCKKESLPGFYCILTVTMQARNNKMVPAILWSEFWWNISVNSKRSCLTSWHKTTLITRFQSYKWRRAYQNSSKFGKKDSLGEPYAGTTSCSNVRWRRSCMCVQPY